jgi:sugar phosphate isomerase/epimerase
VPRSVALFTGQWADLPLETVAKKASSWGFDGLELACWGEHFDAEMALEKDSYIRDKRALLEKYKLKCFSISTHLVGHCVSDDPIDDRHKHMLPPRLWGDGKAERVHQRCAEEVKRTARAAQLLGVDVVYGFTGSSVWTKLYFFPPTSQEDIDVGYKDFAERWIPILDEYKKEQVRFALEVHPTEIAYDIISARRTLDALKNHPSFGFNFDPSHLIHPMINPVHSSKSSRNTFSIVMSKIRGCRSPAGIASLVRIWTSATRGAAGILFRRGTAM